MTARHLEATVRRRSGVAVIDLHGEIDTFAEDVLDSAYTEATTVTPNAVLLNFEDVDYMNSTGIALIVALLTRARQCELRLITSGLSDHYVEIFRVTRLADFIGIFADVESAIGHVAESG